MESTLLTNTPQMDVFEILSLTLDNIVRTQQHLEQHLHVWPTKCVQEVM